MRETNCRKEWFLPLHPFVVMLLILVVIGCDSSDNVLQPIDRGNPIDQLPADGVLRLSGSPYLVTDTLVVESGNTLIIEAGVELGFEPGIPFEVYGKIIAIGEEDFPITFRSGLTHSNRGDWDGIWMIDADDDSQFEYCRFWHGAKYNRRQTLRQIEGQEEVDTLVVDYGTVTLIRSSPSIKFSWFVNSGFHGVHCGPNSSPTIENSVFYNNSGNAIYINSTANPDIRNNIIIENDDYGIYCSEETNSPRNDLSLWYNIIWNNFSGEFNQQTPTKFGRVVTVNGNLDSCDAQYNLRLNPSFVDVDENNAESGDFHLRSISAAIDAGPNDLTDNDDDTRIELGIHHYKYSDGEIRGRIPNPPRVGNRLEAGQYSFTSNIFLPSGETLTIDPGVEISVEGRYRFRIQGEILSDGTAADPISFVSGLSNPSRGDWYGLYFETGDANGSGGAVLNYTNISHAGRGIQLIRRDAIISNCTISESNEFGVYCEDYSSPTISDCRFVNNSQAGVYVTYNSAPSILRNTFSGGDGYGIQVKDHSNPSIYNNLIKNVGTSGISLVNLASPRIINNTIIESGYYGIICDNNSSPVVINNIFYKNGSMTRGGKGVFANRMSHPTVEYNCFWEHDVSSVDISSNMELSPTNLEQDPEFVDINGDYHLTAGSALRTSGDPNISQHMGAFGGQ